MEKIRKELELGRTISQYPTGDTYGYDSMLRWDDTKQVVNSRSVFALQNKGYKINIPIKTQVIK